MTEADVTAAMTRQWEQHRIEQPMIDGVTPRAAVQTGGPALAELEATLDDLAWRRRHAADEGTPVDAVPDPERLRRALGLA